MKEAIIILAVTLSIPVLIALSCSNNGIITLEGFEHGVALCQGGEDEFYNVTKNSVEYKTNGVFFTINKGHSGDKEVNQLEKLAMKECSKYK